MKINAGVNIGVQGQVRRERMLKYKVVTFILLTALFTSAKAYCQQDIKDQQINTIIGKVTYLDVAGDIISVQTYKGTMVFNLSVGSELFHYAHRISVIEIEKGDPVTIQYKKSSLGKNIITRLVDKKQDSSVLGQELLGK